MIYFAHRGTNENVVENTVEAFAVAWAQGARYFELDVHRLKDDALVVHHDYSLATTAGADVKLKDLEMADLSKYPLKNPFHSPSVYVPLLSEILLFLASPELKLLNIELKNDNNVYPDLEKDVLKIIPPKLLPKILFSSFDVSTLQRLRALSKTARIGLLTREFNIGQALSLQAESVHINHTRLTTEIINTCHVHGLKVYCYTVNDRKTAAALEHQGADGIFTDKVGMFIG